MKPKPQFKKQGPFFTAKVIKTFPPVKQTWKIPPSGEVLVFTPGKGFNYDREERAAIHEFDGQLPRPEAEARAAAECQHCGQAAPLQPVWRASYGHGLDVCDGCVAALLPAGWALGDGPKTGNLF